MDDLMVLIPARGGSKGILRKNLQHINGLSLVARACLTAKSASIVDDQRIVVSTDDLEIAEEVRRFGFMVHLRPPELATDESSTEAVIECFFQEYSDVSMLCLIQCTSPFIDPNELKRAFRMFKNDSNIDCLFSGSEHHRFIWRAIDRTTAVSGVNHCASEPRQRRQDREPEFCESGAFYFIRRSAFEKTGNRFGNRPHVFISQSIDIEIDTHEDLNVSRALANCTE